MLNVVFQGHALNSEQIKAIAPLLLTGEAPDPDQIAQALCAMGQPVVCPVAEGFYRVALKNGEELWAKWDGKGWQKALVNLGLVVKKPYLDIAWFGRPLTEEDL